MAMAAVVAFAFVGCEDSVKDDIDAKYNHDVTLPAPECTDITFESVTVSYEIDGDTAGLASAYCGLLFATTEDFSDKIEYAVLPGERKALSVAGSTSYYAKSYFVVGTEIKYSEVTKFTTPAPPEFEHKYLFGSYVAFDDGDEENAYPMEIEWVENTYNRIKIINWWNGGETVTATVDFEKKQIIVDFEPKIFDYSQYEPSVGWVIFYSMDDAGQPTEDPIIATYDDEGNISFAPYYIYLEEYGQYGAGITDMVKQ